MKNYFKVLFFISLSFLSCEEILLEEDISDNSVSLTSPFNNAEFNSTSVTFHWEVVEGSTQYHLQIARPDFTNTLELVVDVVVDSNSSTQQLNIGNYQWRVKAINSNYETPYSARSIKILSNEEFQNNTVILISPTNNLITNVNSQTLSWQNVLGAASYHVQVNNASNVNIVHESTTETSYNYVLPEGSYTWLVRADNGTQQTMYSSRQFLVDTSAPATPTLTLPSNNSFMDGNEVSFGWNRASGSGSAEKDSIYIYKNNTLTNLHLKDEAENPYQLSLESGTYFWFVKAFDEAGNVGNQSNVASFTIN